jgi:hypothetical protein
MEGRSGDYASRRRSADTSATTQTKIVSATLKTVFHIHAGLLTINRSRKWPTLYLAEELAQRNWGRAFHPEDRAKMIDLLRRHDQWYDTWAGTEA